MALKVYPRSTAAIAADCHRGNNHAKANGTQVGWFAALLSTSPGAALLVSTTPTVSGNTTGIEADGGGGSSASREWITPPLSADFTISGAITINLWMAESDMNANVGAYVIIERLDSELNVVSTILDSAKGTELPVTTRAAQNWAPTPTSTACNKGDRIRLRILGKNVGTMGAPYSFTLGYEGGTGAADGDSWIQFTENLTFDTAAPSGSVLYPTVDLASGLTSAAIIKRKAALSRGATAYKVWTETANGWLSPTPVTGGPVVPYPNGAAQVQGGTGSSGEARQQLAQGFKIWDPVNVSTVVLRLSRAGTVLDNVELDIVSSLGGTVLGTSVAVVGSTIGTANSDITFSFLSAVSLSAGDYFLVLRRTGARDTVNCIQWAGSSSGFYPEGEAWQRNDLTWTSTLSPVAYVELFFKIAAAANVIEWYSEPLEAFTLGGLARFSIRALASSTAAFASLRAEIAICDGDGTNPVVWGAADIAPLTTASFTNGVLATTVATRVANVAGDDTSVAQGQRLRFKLYLDDSASAPLVAGHYVEIEYNGPTASATGDFTITLPQTVTEYVAASFSAAPDHLLHRNPYQHLIVR